MLRIRLTRVGKRNQPIYRVVVAEHTKPVKGRFIEVLGTYNPRQEKGAVKLNSERILYWLEKGAKPSATVADILKKEKVKLGKKK
jgi:small subunit ribosomal protein S16